MNRRRVFYCPHTQKLAHMLSDEWFDGYDKHHGVANCSCGHLHVLRYRGIWREDLQAELVKAQS